MKGAFEIMPLDKPRGVGVRKGKSQAEGRKGFFFEKKKQKTFFNLGHGRWNRYGPLRIGVRGLISGDIM
ncbi:MULTISPECIES: hypothetical protein [Acidiphilium]|uniref:hypothetical protein n=1 Tax=Acidiphilium TaxID=522 RepID=UPI0004948FAB|nr:MULTISPECIES: hypothetical protein [Acidiphilium]